MIVRPQRIVFAEPVFIAAAYVYRQNVAVCVERHAGGSLFECVRTVAGRPRTFGKYDEIRAGRKRIFAKFDHLFVAERIDYVQLSDNARIQRIGKTAAYDTIRIRNEGNEKHDIEHGRVICDDDFRREAAEFFFIRRLKAQDSQNANEIDKKSKRK